MTATSLPQAETIMSLLVISSPSAHDFVFKIMLENLKAAQMEQNRSYNGH